MRMDEASDVWMRNWLKTRRFRSGERHSQPCHGNLFCGQSGDSKEAGDPQLSSTFGSVGGRMDTKDRHLLVNSILSLRRVRLVSTWYPNISEVESAATGRKRRKWRKLRNACSMTYIQSVENTLGDVAQLVRALPCHGRGRGFEPRRPRHKLLRMNSLWRTSSGK
jgi:hypothetical protein